MNFLRTLLVALLCCALPASAATWLPLVKTAGGGGGVSVVQSAQNVAPTSAAVTVTFGAGTASGSIIVVGCMAGNSAFTVSSVTDNNSDTSTDSGAGIVQEGTAAFGAFVRAFLAPTTGTTSVTATLSAAQSNFGCVIYEVAGLTSKLFDQGSHNSNVGSSLTTTTGALAQAAEFALVFAWGSNALTASSTSLSPGSSVLDFSLLFGGSNVIQSGHEITAATSALTGQTASGFAGLGIFVETFK